MFSRRMFVALAVCLAVSASSAFAGGNGGTKKDSKLNVENEAGEAVIAIPNISTSQLAGVQSLPTPEAQLDRLVELGGVIIEDNESHEFTVKAGSNTITVITIDDLVFPQGTVLENRTRVRVDKGETETFVVDP